MPLNFWVFWSLFFIVCIVLAIGTSGEAKVQGKARRIKNGPLSDARWATEKELQKEYPTIRFEPEKWRTDPDSRPKEPGFLLGDWHTKVAKTYNIEDRPKYIAPDGQWMGGNVYSRVCQRDYHVLLLGTNGSGKTSRFMNPNIEYALATGISFLVTDTKGDNKKWAGIAQKYYGYNVIDFDIGNPLRSGRWNIMQGVNKNIDLYNACLDKNSEEAVRYLARAEANAKIVSQTIIDAGNEGGSYQGNQYFYDSAKGLLTSSILIVSKYGKKEQRHILSVYKLIQALSGTELDENGVKISKIQILLDELPENSNERFFAAASAQVGDAASSVVSTSLSRLLQFIDSEIGQMIACEESDIDADKFAHEKTVIFVTMQEKYTTRYFMVSLLIQQLYGELLDISAESGKNRVPAPEGFRGKTPRIVFFMDEFANLPKIAGYDQILAASRSRNIFMVTMIQSLSQLDKYGKSTAQTIIDNSKLTVIAPLAPTSNDNQWVSKLLGEYTIEIDSASNSGRGGYGTSTRTRTKQMTKVPLMNPDEVQNKIKQGTMIILRPNNHPIKANYDYYTDWKITLGEKMVSQPRKAFGMNYIDVEELTKAIRAARTEQSKDEIHMDNYIEKMNAQKAEEIKADAQRAYADPVSALQELEEGAWAASLEPVDDVPEQTEDHSTDVPTEQSSTTTDSVDAYLDSDMSDDDDSVDSTASLIAAVTGVPFDSTNADKDKTSGFYDED